jgi:plastocyanin
VVLTRALAGGGLAIAVVAAAQEPRAGLREASVGSIRGKVELRRGAAHYEGRPLVAELGMAAAREPVERRPSVVYLETVPQPAFEAPSPTRAVLDQRSETFVPSVLAITVGSTVDFPNSDKVYHNVFSLSKTRRFDLGRYPRGQSRSVVFDRPGVVRVFCEIHSHMSAFILVFAHRFFAVTDAEGRYRIDGVPPGSYMLALWSEGGVRERRELRLETGQALEQDLVVE